MPQMTPISWLILFLMFSLTFILFNILNYFCFYKNNLILDKKYNSTNNVSSSNWKW